MTTHHNPGDEERMTPARLTTAQRTALRFVQCVCDSPEFGYEISGAHPRQGQERMFAALADSGLLHREGHGVSSENHEREVQLYTITDAGRSALRTINPKP